LHLRSDLPGATFGPLDKADAKAMRIAPQMGLRIPVPALELDDVDPKMNLIESVSEKTPNRPTQPGARTSKFRILHSEYGDRKLTFTVEGLAGSAGILRLIRHGHFIPSVQTVPVTPPSSEMQNASVSYRACDADPYACTSLPLILQFPPGEGWKTITVTLTW